MTRVILDSRYCRDEYGGAIVEHEEYLSSRIMKNSIFILVSRGVQISSSFVIVIAVARYLSVEQYAEYSYIIAFVSSVMTLAYFGIQQVLIREIANDKRSADRIVGVAIQLRALLTALAIIALAASAYFMKLKSLLLVAGLIIIASEVFLSFSMLTKSVFQAYEKMIYEPAVSIVYCLILLIGIIAVIYFDMGLLWLFIATAFANLSQLVICSRILSQRFVRPSFNFDKSVFWTYLKDAAVIGVGIFFYQNLFRLNVLMLKWFGKLEDIAYFQVPHNLIIQLQVLPFAFVTAAFPVVSRLIRNDPARMRAAYEKIFRYMLILSFLVSLVIFGFSKEIITTFFGKKYSLSAAALKIVAWAVVPLSLDMLMNSLLIAMNKQRYAVIYAGITLSLNFFFALLLIPYHGFIAASWLALSAYTLLLMFSFYFVSRNGFTGISYGIVPKVFAGVLIGIAAIYILKSVSLVLALIAAVMLYLGVLYRTQAFRTDELLLVKQLAYKITGKGDPAN